MGKSPDKDLYYTNDHEWIDFQGTIAYVGICSFKLSGFKEIHQLEYRELAGFRRKGEVIASIRYNDYLVEVHMPVDGKVFQVNELLLSGDQNILLQHPEDSGWIAQIVPAKPYERKDLLYPVQYHMNSKSIFVK